MAIQREKIEMFRERQLLMNAITNTEYLKAVAPICDHTLMKTSMGQVLWRWIDAYYREFGKAPQQDIQDLYVTNKLELDEDDSDLIATLLQSLSEDYEKEIPNIEYAIKATTEYLQFRAVENLRDELSRHLSGKDLLKAEQAVTNFKKVAQGRVEGTDVLNDLNAAVDAFTDQDEVLFRLPGVLGQVVGPFRRTDFIAFQGAMKSKKSWALMYTALVAMMRDKNVLYFSLEMPKSQVLRRIWSMLTHSPKKDSYVRIPFFASTDEEGLYKVEHDEKEVKGINATGEWFADWKKKYRTYFRRGGLKLQCFPSRATTVADLIAFADTLEYYEGWLPDVIVIDYADLLIGNNQKDERQMLNDVWVRLRGWAQAKNVCIVTASQSNRGGITGDVGMETIAEDIRKVAHVTKLIGLNATKEEKANGVMRVSNLADREDAECYEQCYVLSCLDLGMFHIDSRLKSEVFINKSKRED